VRWRTIALGVGGLLFLSCLPAQAVAPHGGNCVAYARSVTGIDLDGNAAAWWPHAAGRYERGQLPKLGAILVFKPYGHMHVGHVAVVSRVVGPREILVDQANWIRGRVVKSMSVVDASLQNDWTSVKVIELHSGTHGRENPTYGFIYPRDLPAGFVEANTDTTDTRHERVHIAHAHDKTKHDSKEPADAEAGADQPERDGKRLAAAKADSDKPERDGKRLAAAKADSDKPERDGKRLAAAKAASDKPERDGKRLAAAKDASDKPERDGKRLAAAKAASDQPERDGKRLAAAKTDADKPGDDGKPAHAKQAKHHAQEDAKLAYLY
jgi:surface antigen